jgi:hypothetical protein
MGERSSKLRSDMIRAKAERYQVTQQCNPSKAATRPAAEITLAECDQKVTHPARTTWGLMDLGSSSTPCFNHGEVVDHLCIPRITSGKEACIAFGKCGLV